MIKLIFGWLWNFNKPHVHDWQFERKEEIHEHFLTDNMHEVLVYKCSCGAMVVLKSPREE